MHQLQKQKHMARDAVPTVQTTLDVTNTIPPPSDTVVTNTIPPPSDTDAAYMVQPSSVADKRMVTPGDDDILSMTLIHRMTNTDGEDGPLTEFERTLEVTLLCSMLFVLALVRLVVHVCFVCVCCECCMCASVFHITHSHTPHSRCIGDSTATHRCGDKHQVMIVPVVRTSS